jgi:hypothetical protein
VTQESTTYIIIYSRLFKILNKFLFFKTGKCIAFVLKGTVILDLFGQIQFVFLIQIICALLPLVITPSPTKDVLAARKFNNSRLTDLEIVSFNLCIKQKHQL